MDITTKNIEQMQILITTKDGQYLLAQTNEEMLFCIIAQYCKFVKINPDVIGQESLINIMLKDK